MRKVKISIIDLETAFEMSSMDNGCWLDTEKGEIVSINDNVMDSEEIESISSEIDSNPGRFIEIPQRETAEEYRDMQDFADSVKDKNLKEKLFIALNGKGAFRRFKDVLYDYPQEQKKWYKLKDEKLKQYIKDWLKENELELSEE